MTDTARTVIQAALENLGLYAPGETMSAADAARGLSVLQDMMDSWSNEDLLCFTILEQQLVYVPGQFRYTIGVGGFVNGTRPLKINDAPGSAYTLDNNGNQYPMDVITRPQWNQRGSRNTNSNFPDVLFYDPTYPLGVINFDPIPNVGYTAFFDSFQQLGEPGTLDAAIAYPPGYRRAIRSNLAIELKPFFAEAQLDPLVAIAASESKANVKRKNIRNDTALYDPEIMSKAPGIYNIYNDSYRR